MDIGEFSSYWSLVEAILLLVSGALSFYLFFKDPIRRWRFFGYRPTAIMSIIDPHTQEVLLVKNLYSDQWLMPQGGILSNDIILTINETMLREAGLEPYHYAVSHVEPLKTLPLSKYSIKRKFNLGGVSLFPRLRGKGYIACYLIADMKEICNLIKLRSLTDQVRVLPLLEAKKQLMDSYREVGNTAKFALTNHILAEQAKFLELE